MFTAGTAARALPDDAWLLILRLVEVAALGRMRRVARRFGPLADQAARQLLAACARHERGWVVDIAAPLCALRQVFRLRQPLRLTSRSPEVAISRRRGWLRPVAPGRDAARRGSPLTVHCGGHTMRHGRHFARLKLEPACYADYKGLWQAEMSFGVRAAAPDGGAEEWALVLRQSGLAVSARPRRGGPPLVAATDGAAPRFGDVFGLLLDLRDGRCERPLPAAGAPVSNAAARAACGCS